MGKYKLKAADVNAVQYFKGVEIKGLQMSEGWKASGHWSDRFNVEPDEKSPYIYSLTYGKIFLKEGDWIVTESNGTQLVYTNDEFNAKYEPIKEIEIKITSTGSTAYYVFNEEKPKKKAKQKRTIKYHPDVNQQVVKAMKKSFKKLKRK